MEDVVEEDVVEEEEEEYCTQDAVFTKIWGKLHDFDIENGLVDPKFIWLDINIVLKVCKMAKFYQNIKSMTPLLTPHLQKLVFQPLPSYFPSDLFKKGVKMLRGSHSIRYWAELMNLTHRFYFTCIQGG